MDNKLIAFGAENKWGYKNQAGDIVIEALFEGPLLEFTGVNQILTMEDDARDTIYLLYDRTGKMLVNFNEVIGDEVSGIYPMPELNLYIVNTYDWDSNELAALVNSKGEILIPAEYETIDHIGYGFFKAYYSNPHDTLDDDGILMKGKYAVYNSNGQQLLRPQFDEVGAFNGTFSIASIDEDEFKIYPNGRMEKYVEEGN